MELSKAQRKVMNELKVGSLPVSEVHPSTLEALKRLELVDVRDDEVYAVDQTAQPAPSRDDMMVENIIVLGVEVSVNTSDGMVTLPKGSEHPIVSYTEEKTPRMLLKWFTCLHVPSGSYFVVNSIASSSKIVEPRPLSSFK